MVSMVKTLSVIWTLVILMPAMAEQEVYRAKTAVKAGFTAQWQPLLTQKQWYLPEGSILPSGFQAYDDRVGLAPKASVAVDLKDAVMRSDLVSQNHIALKTKAKTASLYKHPGLTWRNCEATPELDDCNQRVFISQGEELKFLASQLHVVVDPRQQY